MNDRLIEALREKAHEYELNGLAARERDDSAGALCFATMALAFYELANTFEHELEEAA